MNIKTSFPTKIAKGTLGTVAAGAMALASAAPAAAEDHRKKDKISAGEVIAGALIIGGIAAVASSIDNRRGARYAHGGYYDGHRYANPRFAINRCVRAAEKRARRIGGWRYADVTSIRDVDRTRRGFRVKGRIAVEGHRYSRRNSDRGRFTCYFDGRGRPVIDFDSVRGLR